MRTISSNLLDPERTKLHENIKGMFHKAGAVNKDEFDEYFYLLDKCIPWDTNAMYDLIVFFRDNIFLIRLAAIKQPTTPFNSNDDFVEYVEKHMAVFAKPTDTEKFVQMAEEYGAIPCFMMIDMTTMQPVEAIIGDKIIKDGKLSRKGQIYRWGLVNAETLEPVDPNNMKKYKNKPMTDWEKRIFCINFVCERLAEDNDCRILDVDDRANAEPNIWFHNASGELCWVKIEYGQDESVLKEPVHVSQKTKDSCPGTGYTARIVFTKDPYRVHHRDGGGWKYSDLMPIK